jgi:imidazolonepropionase-like amidohydrolase
MSRFLFTNVRIIDGEANDAYPGEVLVEGERIAAVSRDGRLKRDGAELVEGQGRTLMPGLVEAHAHLSFLGFQDLWDSARIPVEEHLLGTLESARLLLDQGFTSCFSAAAAKPRLDVVVRDAIEAGRFPGPRLLAATQEMTPSGNLGDLDSRELTLPPTVRFAVTCDSPDAFRAACRIAARDGVDTFKVNVSGDRGFDAWGAGTDATVMTDEELAAIVQVARARGKRGGGARHQRRLGQALPEARRRGHLSRGAGRRGGPGRAGGGARPRLRRPHHRLSLHPGARDRALRRPP